VEEWLTQLQASACLLFLSRLETFGVVVLESLACEIPVVSLQNKGIDDIPVREVIPILGLNPDVAQIIQAMEQVIDRFKPGIGQKLRTDLRSRFDFPVVAGQYITLYQNILNSPN
jgi:glycosyltransferase involved in cell wall biosynthesis